MKTIRREIATADLPNRDRGRQDRPSRPVLTCDDRRRLGSLVTDGKWQVNASLMYALDARLDQAEYVEREEVPDDVVTMNSTVELIDLLTDEVLEVTLVYPYETEFYDQSVSVLRPLGLALLGSTAGSVVQCRKDGRRARYRIAAVTHQPEWTFTRH